MQLTTHLTFNGDCRAAFEMYERILGGKITFMITQGESPMAEQIAPEWRGKIMHVSLQTPGGGILLGADCQQGHKVEPAGFCVSVQTDEKADAERIFKALADGGKTQMEFQQTFWSPGFGMCVDKFGTPWMVNTAGAMG